MKTRETHQRRFYLATICFFVQTVLLLCIAHGQQRDPYLVMDLTTSSADSSSSYPEDFCRAGDWIYCIGSGSSSSSYESIYWLFRSGNSGGAREISLGSYNSIRNAFAFGKSLYFTSLSSVLETRSLMKLSSPTEQPKIIRELGSYYPHDFTAGGDTLFFILNSGNTGEELWKTIESYGYEYASMVRDINPGSASSAIGDPLWFNGALYFWANDGIHGLELWSSDGTTSGTRIVKDIAEGMDDAYVPNSSGDSSLVVWNNQLCFAADDGSGTVRLWQTDGTSTGTKPFLPLTSLAGLGASEKGVFYVQRIMPGSDCELWITDGLAFSAQLLKRFSSDSFDYPRMTSAAGNLFFILQEEGIGRELWMSDGTSAGTRLVRDIWPGPASSNPSLPVEWQGSLFFHANVGIHGRELWTCDANGHNARLIKDIGPLSSLDDTAELLPTEHFLLFPANDGKHGVEPWMTDGTEEGTALFCDINGKASGSYFSDLVGIQDQLLFAAGANNIAGASTLWKSGGLKENTVPVTQKAAPINQTASGQSISGGRFSRNVDNQLFFYGNNPQTGWEIWKSDGTDQGTKLVKDITPGIESTGVRASAASGRLFYFRKKTGNGSALIDQMWRSDGTASGTFPVKSNDLDGSFTLTGAGNGKGSLCFVANDPVWGKELWLSDGTTSGTQRATSLTSATNQIIYPEMGYWKDSFYFVDKQNDGWRLHKLNASTKQAEIIKKLDFGMPSNASLYSQDSFTIANNQLFFRIVPSGASYKQQIWKTDGTPSGTELFTSATSVLALTEHNGFLFYMVYMENLSLPRWMISHGLWKTDGTRSGTVLVKEFSNSLMHGYYVPATGAKDFFGTLGDFIYFSVSLDYDYPDLLAGSSFLWKSDGTPEGTVQCEISPNAILLNPRNFTQVGESLFFTADDGIHGNELWRIAPFGITRAATWENY